MDRAFYIGPSLLRPDDRGTLAPMYGWIARHVKRYWDSDGPFGKVVAVLLVLGASVGISALRYSTKRAIVKSATGCGVDEEGMNARWRGMLGALEKQYGKPQPFGDGSDRIVFPEAQFNIAYITMYDPCDSFLGIRVPIEGAAPPPLPPKRLLEVLEDRNIGGKYERGAGGSFMYDDHSKAYYLSYIVLLKQERAESIVKTIDERRQIGETWRNGWFEEVWRIAMGEAPAPKDPVYRPGKDPESILRGVDAFLKDAGQQGIYP